jgi:hypothetical protein
MCINILNGVKGEPVEGFLLIPIGDKSEHFTILYSQVGVSKQGTDYRLFSSSHVSQVSLKLEKNAHASKIATIFQTGRRYSTCLLMKDYMVKQ